MERLREILDLQSGVIGRQQAHACGVRPAEIERMLRRRELVRVVDGVFLNHTGELSWLQRAWVAVLSCSPAALYGASALRAAAGPGLRSHDDSASIHVAVDRRRKVKPVVGVVAHRVAALASKTQWNRSPPRLRVEEAVVDVAAAAATDYDAMAEIARVVGARSTTPSRILKALEGRSRIRRREFLVGVLEDVAAGACSALEVAYVRRVERAHGLPTGSRQVQASSRGPVYRDVEYLEFGVVIELDGRLDHSALTDRDRDMERDLDAAVDSRVTARLGWGLVVGRSCTTARKVHRLLASRGLTQPFHPCPACAST